MWSYHAHADSSQQIYAAGSLREAMTALEREYRSELELKGVDAKSFELRYVFGPSGKLRERIEAGERPALFASASPQHTERLQKAGLLQSANLFAGNSLCILARPEFSLANKNIVNVLLDPAVAIGTSTPGC